MCALQNEEIRAFRGDIHLTRNDVFKILRLGKAFVLFSGGKDSLCLLDYVRRLARSINKEVVAVHANTTAGFPEVESYVRRVCRKLGVKLVTVRPHGDFFDLAKRWGIPGVKSRWCCKTLKVAPIRRFLSTQQGHKVVFDGIRSAESGIRATYIPVWYHPSFRCISASPIFAWSDKKVAQYIERSDLPPNPCANMGTSAECWCGAYKGRADFEALLQAHPDIFDKLVQVEKAQRGKYTFLYENGRRIELSSLKTEPTGPR